MDCELYLSRRSRRAVSCVVAAISAFYSSIGFFELSAQSAPTAGGPLPPMSVPADNPQNDAKIKLGRQLYFDGRLSANDKISCATCHDPKRDGPDTMRRTQASADVLGTAIRELSSILAT